MASVGDRHNDSEYRNWIRATLCLQYTRDGLVTFAEQKSKELFKKVIPQLGHQGITTANDLCRSFRFNKRTKTYSCCNGCDVFVDELNQYLHGIAKLNLNNSDTNYLLQDHWQVAKFYMNVGQDKANPVPNNTDISGLLNFMDHCLIPRNGIAYPDNIKKVRDTRNRIIHSSNQKVSDNDFLNDTALFIQLLEDPKTLLYNQEAKRASENIKEIKADKFVITKETERKALEELVKEIHQMMAQAKQTDESSQSIREEVNKRREEIQTLLERLKPYEELHESFRAAQEDFNARFGLICQEQKRMKKDIDDLKKGTQEARTPSEDELNRLAAHLKEGYAENDKFYIPVLPGCLKIPVGEIFAPVILTKNDAGKEQPLSSYKAMLCQEVPKQQLFLVGEAGAGKSTFSKHLIDVWRSGSTKSQFDNPEELRKFEFVFHVSCRFATKTDSVLDMICEQLCYDESMKKIATHVLSHSPESCFIIIDGLDEWQGHPGKSSARLCDTTGLPSRKGVEGCLILITSRPWRLQALGKEIEPKARFELNGLQSPELLIEKILSKLGYPDPAILCKNFLRDVKICGLTEMIKTPLILIIVLSIWEQSSDSEENKSLHPSLCRNYMTMIESLIQRADDKQHWTGDESRLFEPLVKNPEYWKKKWEEESGSLPSCCQELCCPELKSFRTFAGLIVSLGKLAFNLLFGESTSDEQKLVFSKQDCKKYLSDEEINVCLGIGILSKSQTSRGMKKMESYSFPHKTFQEFLSALWLAGPGADSVGRITERTGLYRAVNNVEMLLKFLSGLGPQVAVKPLQYMYTQYIKYYSTSRINQFILSCCAESQHCNNTKHTYFTFPEIELHWETISDDDIRMWANIVEASSSCLRQLVIWNLRLRHESVEEPSDIPSCHSSIDTLYQSLSCCGNLEELRLGKISCSDDRHNNISSVPLDLHNFHKLEKLTLWEMSVPTVLWPQVTNSGLRRLVIRGLKLTHECVEEPSDIPSCHSSIVTLYQALSCCGNLEELRLEKISCRYHRHNNISPVPLDLHNHHKLEELTLWELSVRNVLWPQVTNSCLRWLDIEHLNLTHECVEELCRTYEQCRQLEREWCEVRSIFCVDHKTRCDSFKDLQQHFMLVNLPYFDDDDN